MFSVVTPDEASTGTAARKVATKKRKAQERAAAEQRRRREAAPVDRALAALLLDGEVLRRAARGRAVRDPDSAVVLVHVRVQKKQNFSTVA